MRKDHSFTAFYERERESKIGMEHVSTSETEAYCTHRGMRKCNDGSCISRPDLCPEEEKVNQNTLLIMIILGIAVVIAMVILYCFQQRSRRLQSGNQRLEVVTGDGDNLSLDNPPPSYDEVIGSNLYLSTSISQTRQNGTALDRIPSNEEPMTPPPNYDAALTILAQSHESYFLKAQEEPSGSMSSVIRRTISTETTSPISPIRSPTRTTQHFDFRRNTSVNEGS